MKKQLSIENLGVFNLANSIGQKIGILLSIGNILKEIQLGNKFVVPPILFLQILESGLGDILLKKINISVTMQEGH